MPRGWDWKVPTYLQCQAHSSTFLLASWLGAEGDEKTKMCPVSIHGRLLVHSPRGCWPERSRWHSSRRLSQSNRQSNGCCRLSHFHLSAVPHCKCESEVMKHDETYVLYNIHQHSHLTLLAHALGLKLHTTTNNQPLPLLAQRNRPDTAWCNSGNVWYVSTSHRDNGPHHDSVGPLALAVLCRYPAFPVSIKSHLQFATLAPQHCNSYPSDFFRFLWHLGTCILACAMSRATMIVPVLSSEGKETIQKRAPIRTYPLHSFPFLSRLFVGTNWNLQVRPVTPFHLSRKTWQWLLRFDNDRDPNNAKRVETGNWLRYFRFSSVHWRMAIVSFGGWLLASMGLFRSTLTISPAICKHHKNNFLCSSYFVRVLLVAFDNWLDIVEVCQTQSADSPPFSKDFSVMSGKYLNEMDCIGVNPWNLWSTFPAQHCLLRPSYCKGPYFAGSVSSFSRKTPSSVIFACSCNEVEQHEEAATTGNENFSHWLRKLGIRNHQATAFM